VSLEGALAYISEHDQCTPTNRDESHDERGRKDTNGRQEEWREIGVWHVSIIWGVLFTSQLERLRLGLVESARLLRHGLTAFEEVDVTKDFRC
jgi:hypothetical protein